MKPSVIIANCGGFWGDDPTAARRQVEGGPIDYLVMDYLAEVTMAILQKQRRQKAGNGLSGRFPRASARCAARRASSGASKSSPTPGE